MKTIPSKSKAIFELVKGDGFFFDKDTFVKFRSRALVEPTTENIFALESYLSACKDTIDMLHKASRDLFFSQ